MNNVLGIVFSNMHEHMVSELTARRCMGSIPIGGRYRLIDFILSGFANSGISDVGIITKSNYQSLMDHVGYGREWDLYRKNGGLVILPPFGRAQAGVYKGRIEALSGISGYIGASHAEYIIAADCDVVANIDFTDFIAFHEKSGAKITVMYKKMPTPKSTEKNWATFLLSQSGQPEQMLINPQIEGDHNTYLNIMIVGRQYLKDLIAECCSQSKFSFEKDVLQEAISRQEVAAWEFKGYLSRVDCMRTYYEANLDLLDSDVRLSLFPKERPIYTKVRDEAPVRYGLNCSLSNSMLADGCLVEGEVENSILFRGVSVEKGAKVKNSVIMQATKIGAYSSLDYVITDKDVTIKDHRTLVGFETYPAYIAKGAIV